MKRIERRLREREGLCNGFEWLLGGATKMVCTEGWDCDLGSGGLEIFFANNGLGGFLGPNWKVFHHGTLCEHFQGVVIAFRSWPGGENGAKID